ncbi:MAG: hypothetical protein Q8K28_21940 [Hoeflea sp.]|uniref:hypothetical protein n=1 Tax=Hoeflea sp. TaxID=1940281 RepID=UPI00272F44B6|nr:hypothetical protein [Hoeflea sp.]MDP2122571.1 hypothetical protein [Hoeflea sp.]
MELSRFLGLILAALSDGITFDPFLLDEDDLTAPEVDVGRGWIGEAVVVSAMVAMLDERRDLDFEVFLKEEVFKENALPERLVPALNLALGLRMVGSAMHLFDGVFSSQSSRSEATQHKPLPDSRRTRFSTLTLSQPEAARDRSCASVTSSTCPAKSEPSTALDRRSNVTWHRKSGGTVPTRRAAETEDNSIRVQPWATPQQAPVARRFALSVLTLRVSPLTVPDDGTPLENDVCSQARAIILQRPT